MNGLTDPGVALYVCAAVAVLVWLGIFAYLWRIDAQARALTQAMKQTPPDATVAPALRPERQLAPTPPKEAHDAER